MKNPRAPRTAALQFEALESRLPLAGNVTAAIKSGSLVITGDDAVNQVGIESLAPAFPTRIRVFNLDDTRINTPDPNDPNPLFEVEFDVAELKDVKIDMKKALNGAVAAADVVEIAGLNVSGKLDIKGKNAGEVFVATTDVGKTTTVTFGNGLSNATQGTQLRFNECDLAGNTTITTGINNDTVTINDTTIGGKLTVKTNAGNDQVRVEGNYVPGVNILLDVPTIRGNVDIQTKDGDDSVFIFDQKINGKTTLNAGLGRNNVQIRHSVLGIATDFTKSSKAKCNDVVITTASAATNVNENVIVEDNIFARHLTISTKAGGDFVRLRNSFVGFHCTGNLKITTGDSNDDVTFDGRALAGDTVMPVVPNPNIGNGIRVTGTTTIDTGKGDDEVQVGRDDLAGSHRFQGKTTTALGDGVNDMRLIGELTGTAPADFASTTTFESDLVTSVGAGSDFIFVFGVLMRANHPVTDKGGGLAIMNNNTAILGNLSVTSGAGADVLAIGTLGVNGAQNFVGGTTTVKTGAGAEKIWLANANLAGKVAADLAGDRDQLLIEDATLDINATVVKVGNASEDNRGTANGQDLGALGAAGFVAGGVDADFKDQVEAAFAAHFGELINDIMANL